VKPVERDMLVTSVQRLYRPDVGQDVLVVEDDYATRRLLRRYLQRDGWTVRTAADGQEALEEMQQQSPGLVLLDLMMPVMDGLEFLSHLRAESRWDDVPVVVTTGKDLSDEERTVLDASVSRVLSKHAHSMHQILDEVRQIAGRDG
jgi:CheY-like chemotaxis protein